MTEVVYVVGTASVKRVVVLVARSSHMSQSRADHTPTSKRAACRVHCCCASARRSYVMRVSPFCHNAAPSLLSVTRQSRRSHRSHMNTDGIHLTAGKKSSPLASLFSRFRGKITQFRPHAATHRPAMWNCTLFSINCNEPLSGIFIIHGKGPL